MGAHALHLLAWLFGAADQVWATISNRAGIYSRVDDFGIFHIRFSSGLLATAEAGWIDIDEPGKLEIFGDSGSLHAGDLYAEGGRLHRRIEEGTTAGHGRRERAEGRIPSDGSNGRKDCSGRTGG